MGLNFKKYGEGKDSLVILHGLFGSLDNWQSLAKKFGAYFTVYILDQRNHGKSPHFDEHNYVAMASDLKEFLDQEGIEETFLLDQQDDALNPRQMNLWRKAIEKEVSKSRVAFKKLEGFSPDNV